MALVRILSLIWADVLAEYALWVLMTYLTDVWDLGFTHAAAIINVYRAVVNIMPIALQFIVDTFLGNYWMLFISNFAFSVGLGLLSMSTPPVLGSCHDYKPECIGDSQKNIFYIALALIAIGMAGHMVSLGQFLADQILVNQQQGVADTGFCGMFLSILAVILVPIIAVIALPYIKPWSVRFGIPAICTVVATLLFLSGSFSYHYVQPGGSPLTTVFRVFVASASKLFRRLPRDVNLLYENNGAGLHIFPHTKGLRCLDKAAILLSTENMEQQQGNRWRLCRVTEVEETKTIIRMIPMWITFIFCGVVSSIGFTYFVEQANHMNQKVGRLTVPLPVLLWFYDKSKSVFASFYYQIAYKLGGNGAAKGKYAPSIGFAVSMIFAVLCCITAAKVENRRLDVVRSHDLLDKPKETIPMTMFWLLPQFILLGGLDGISESSTASFFVDQVPASMFRYIVFFINGVFGLGFAGSVLSVFLVGKVSEKGGKQSWFQHTLNRSRLDKYYWTLAWLAAVNLAVFIVMAALYRYKDVQVDNGDAPEFDETDEPYDGIVQSCCCCCA